jgi:hypothetical protein
MILPVWTYAAIGAVLLAVGAYFYIDHEARVNERNAAAARTHEESEKGRKLRETNDEAARSLDDQRALECLRKPTGC